MIAVDIINYSRVINKIASQDISDLCIAYTVAQNIQRLALPLQLIEEERASLINAYAERDENGNCITDADGMIKVNDRAEFVPKWNKLYSSDLDVDIVPLKLSKLCEADVKLSVADIIDLKNNIVNDMEE